MIEETKEELIGKIIAKYPQYAYVDKEELYYAFVKKYPQYMPIDHKPMPINPKDIKVTPKEEGGFVKAMTNIIGKSVVGSVPALAQGVVTNLATSVSDYTPLGFLQNTTGVNLGQKPITDTLNKASKVISKAQAKVEGVKVPTKYEYLESGSLEDNWKNPLWWSAKMAQQAGILTTQLGTAYLSGGSPIASIATMATLETGFAKEELMQLKKAENLDISDNEINVLATGVGVVNGLIEQASGITGTLNKAFKKGITKDVVVKATKSKAVRDFLFKVGKVSLEEAPTEALQEISNITAGEFAKNKDFWQAITNAFTKPENIKRYAEAGAIGGVTGLGAGVVANIPNRKNTAKQSELPKADETYTVKDLIEPEEEATPQVMEEADKAIELKRDDAPTSKTIEEYLADKVEEAKETLDSKKLEEKIAEAETFIEEASEDENLQDVYTEEEITQKLEAVEEAKNQLSDIQIEELNSKFTVLSDYLDNNELEASRVIFDELEAIFGSLDKERIDETIYDDFADNIKSVKEYLSEEEQKVKELEKLRQENEKQAQAEKVEDSNEDVRKFAERIAKGEKLTSKEDEQFMANNASRVNDELRNINEDIEKENQAVIKIRNKILEKEKADRIKELESIKEKNRIEKEQKTDDIGDNKEQYDGDDLILKHGTGADFDKFLTDKIGTGEGNQSFGYGLYFTGSDKIGKEYATKLSKDKEGIVYTVKIKNAKNKKFVEWRDTLDETEEQSLLDSMTEEDNKKYQEYLDNISQEKRHTGTVDMLRNDDIDELIAFGNLYKDLSDGLGQKRASEILKESGFDGIKYRSRKGYGLANNYVIFDANDIEIIDKSKSVKSPQQAINEVISESVKEEKPAPEVKPDEAKKAPKVEDITESIKKAKDDGKSFDEWIKGESGEFGTIKKIDITKPQEQPFVSRFAGDFETKKSSASGLTYSTLDKISSLNTALRQKGFKGVSSVDFKGVYSLDKIIDNQKLFEKYPQLKEINVYFVDFHTPTQRGVEINGNIFLNSKLYAKDVTSIESTLVHEIEHVIQNIENKLPKYSQFEQGRGMTAEEYAKDLREEGARKKQQEYIDVIKTRSQLKSEWDKYTPKVDEKPAEKVEAKEETKVVVEKDDKVYELKESDEELMKDKYWESGKDFTGTHMRYSFIGRDFENSLDDIVMVITTSKERIYKDDPKTKIYYTVDIEYTPKEIVETITRIKTLKEAKAEAIKVFKKYLKKYGDYSGIRERESNKKNKPDVKNATIEKESIDEKAKPAEVTEVTKNDNVTEQEISEEESKELEKNLKILSDEGFSIENVTEAIDKIVDDGYDKIRYNDEGNIVIYENFNYGRPIPQLFVYKLIIKREENGKTIYFKNKYILSEKGWESLILKSIEEKSKRDEVRKREKNEQIIKEENERTIRLAEQFNKNFDESHKVFVEHTNITSKMSPQQINKLLKEEKERIFKALDDAKGKIKEDTEIISVVIGDSRLMFYITPDISGSIDKMIKPKIEEAYKPLKIETVQKLRRSNKKISDIYSERIEDLQKSIKSNKLRPSDKMQAEKELEFYTKALATLKDEKGSVSFKDGKGNLTEYGKALLTVAKYNIRNGATKLRDFVVKMKADTGKNFDKIRKYLRELYDMAKRQIADESGAIGSDDNTTSIQKAKASGKSFDEWVNGQEKNDILLETAKDYKNADDFISFYRGSSTQYGKYKPEIRKFGTTEESIRVPELGVDPEKKITIYRGIDTVQGGKIRGTINDGDFVTTDFDSAKAYTGGKVMSKEVKAKDLIIDYPEKRDFENPFYIGAEFIYSHNKNKLIKYSNRDLVDIFEKSKSYDIKIPISEWEKQVAYIQKNGKIPPNADIKGFLKSPEYNKYGTSDRQKTSAYYEYVANKIQEQIKTISKLKSEWDSVGNDNISEIISRLKDEKGSVSFKDGKGNLTEYGKALLTVAKYNIRNGATKLRDFVVKMKADTGKNFDKIRKYLRELYDMAKRQIADESGMIVGEKYADKSRLIKKNLEIANEMEQDGKDKLTIRLATGWERGIDKKWRYEVDDFELTDEFKDFDDTNIRFPLDKAIKGKVKAKLFKAYPELKEIGIVIRDTRKYGGEYDRTNKTINLSTYLGGITLDSMYSEIKTTMLHEIQHAIQYIEGFDTGSSPAYFEREAEVYNSKMSKEKEEKLSPIKNKIRKFIFGGFANNLYDYITENEGYFEYIDDEGTTIKLKKDNIGWALWDSLFDNNFKSVNDALRNMKYHNYDVFWEIKLVLDRKGGRNAFVKELRYLDTLVKKYTKLDTGNSYVTPKDFYKRVSGEVEARNVQARNMLTPEQRKAMTLESTEDYPRSEQQISGKNEGITYSSIEFPQKKKFIIKKLGLQKKEAKPKEFIGNITHKVINEKRENIGLEEVEKGGFLDNGRAIGIAKDNTPKSLTESIRNMVINSEKLPDSLNAGNIKLTELEASKMDLLAELSLSKEKGDTKRAEVINNEIFKVEKEYGDLSEVIAKATSMGGSVLNTASMEAVVDLAGEVVKWKKIANAIKNDKEATQEDRDWADKKYTELQEAYNDLKKEMAKEKANFEESVKKEAERRFNEAKMQYQEQQKKLSERKEDREKTKTRNSERRTDIRQKLKNRGINTRFNINIIGVDVEVLKLVVELAQTYVSDGVTNFEELVDKMRTELPDFSREDVIYALSYKAMKEARQSLSKHKKKELKRIDLIRREATLLDDIDNALETGSRRFLIYQKHKTPQNLLNLQTILSEVEKKVQKAMELSNYTSQSVKELEKKQALIRSLMERILTAKKDLAMAQKGVFKQRLEKNPESDEIKNIRKELLSLNKQITELRKKKDLSGIKVLMDKRDEVMKTLENAKKGIFEKKEKVEKDYTEEEQKIVDELNEAMKNIRDFKKGYNYDEKANKILKALETNDFSAFEPITRQGLLNQSVIEKKIRLNVLMKEMAQRKSKAEMSKWEFYVRDVLQIPQFLQTTLDFPPIMGRQGVIQFWKNPKAGIDAWFKGLSTMAYTKKAVERAETIFAEQIQGHPDYYEAVNNGIRLDNVDDIGIGKELPEQYRKGIIDKIPIIKQVRASSGRGFVTSVNLLRIKAYETFKKAFPTSSTEDRKAMAEYINASTGKAVGGVKTNAFIKLASWFMFAPNFRLSLFQTPYMAFKHRKIKSVRNIILKDLGMFFGSRIALLAIMKILSSLFDWEDTIDVGFDPRDSDFLRLKIFNTHFDIFGGFITIPRVIIRGIMTQQWLPDYIKEDESLDSIIFKFFKYQSSTWLSLFNSLWTGKDIFGRDISVTKAIINSSTPLSPRDLVEAVTNNDEVNPYFAWTLGIPSLFGFSSNSYDKNDNNGGVTFTKRKKRKKITFD